MTTISVPLSADLLHHLEDLIKNGKASNKADAVRRALKFYIEQEAVEDVLQAMNEPTLHGDLRTLAKKFR
jgi:Arc/MetJ-type ribon-helix-helix transcriptional regulator